MNIDVKEIFLVTHPQATHHVEDRVGGWFDSELTALGLEHAQQIAHALAASLQPCVKLYSSDLRRTAQTTIEIEKLLQGVRSTWMPELREKSYGIGEGRPDTWFRPRFIPPPPTGQRMEHHEGIEGSETKLRWAQRAYSAMDTITAEPSSQKVIVTHGGTATFVIAHWIGMPIDALAHVSFKVDPGSITHLIEDDYFHNRTVNRLNDSSHLN